MAENNIPPSKFGPKGLVEEGSAPKGIKEQRKKVLDALVEYLAEARTNAKEWQDKAQRSWDMLHGRINWSHKKADQSKLHINRVGLAHEQIKAQIKEGLMSFDKWLIVEPEAGFDAKDDLFEVENVHRMVMRGIRRTNPKAQLTDNIGTAVVENQLATKLQPIMIERKGPGGKTIKEFHIDHISLNIRSYYPDARFGDLYEFHEVELDHHKVMALSSDNPTPQKPYIKEIVKNLASGKPRVEETNEDRDKGNDNTRTTIGRRRSHVLHEFWGTVLEQNGEIMKWKNEDGTEMELKDVVITIANSEAVISDPQQWPGWDGTSDFITMQLLRSNINKYGRSLLAPGVDMNKAEDELVSAGVDAAMKESYNVNTLKVHGLARKEQADGGIKYGTTFLQNNQLAPGEKLIDTVATGKVPQGLLSILSLVQSAGSENMRMNEVALSGALPSKQVRATEVVAAGQTIQGLFESIVSDIEDVYIEIYGKKVFNMMLQNAKLLNDDDLKYIFYGNEDKIKAFKELSARKLFDEYGSSFRFRGKGIRSHAQNTRQSQTLVNLFSVIVANPLMLDAFERRGLDVTKMMDEVIRGQGLDMQKYISQETADFAKQRQLVREEALAQAEVQGQNQQAPGTVNTPQGPGPTDQEPGSGAGA